MDIPIGYLLKQIHIKFQKRMDRNLQSENLTLAQLDMLHFLIDHEQMKITQKDIAEGMEIMHTTVIGTLKRLEEKGFVICVIDPENKKYRNIYLTEKSSHVKERLQAHRRDMEDLIAKGLTADEKSTLVRLLKKVRDNIS